MLKLHLQGLGVLSNQVRFVRCASTAAVSSLDGLPPPIIPAKRRRKTKAKATTWKSEQQQQQPQPLGREKKKLLRTPLLDINNGPKITVMGVGGAGGNAVDNMIASALEGVEFLVANTDYQALARSTAPSKISLGETITRGLGAGSKPELGRLAAETHLEEIRQSISGSHMLFITGGMGGGTCTGAAPVIARAAREIGILTVAVVTTPFRSEGPNRTRIAHAGVTELARTVDTLIVVPNQNLLSLCTKNTTMLDAFRHADAVLLGGVKGVTDLVVKPGLINLDFADINTILCNAGRAMMGAGVASGEDRARIAAEKALANPLLGDLPTSNASGLLVTISGGPDMTLFEVDQVMYVIRSHVSEAANVIFGTCCDKSLAGEIHISLIVGGIEIDEVAPTVKSTNTAKLNGPNTNHSTQESQASAAAAAGPEAKPPRNFFSRLFTFT